MSFCRNCGAELPHDARFCASCGTPAGSSQPDIHIQPAEGAAPVSEGGSYPNMPTQKNGEVLPPKPPYGAGEAVYTNAQPYGAAGTVHANGQPYGAGEAVYANGQPYGAAGTVHANGQPYGAGEAVYANGQPYGTAGTVHANGQPYGAGEAVYANAQPYGAAGTIYADGQPYGTAGTVHANGQPYGAGEAVYANAQPYGAAGTIYADGQPYGTAGTVYADGQPYGTVRTVYADGQPYGAAGTIYADGQPYGTAGTVYADGQPYGAAGSPYAEGQVCGTGELPYDNGQMMNDVQPYQGMAIQTGGYPAENPYSPYGCAPQPQSSRKVLAAISMVVGLIVAAALILLIVLLTRDNSHRTYEQVIGVLMDGLIKQDMDRLSEAFPERLREEMRRDLLSDYDSEGAFWEEYNEWMEWYCGKNAKLTYTIVRAVPLLDYQVREYEEDCMQKYRYDVSISSGYEVEMEVTYKGSEGWITNSIELDVVKIDGKWYVIIF